MKNIRLACLFALTLTLSVSSCKKGCTDDAANNFDNSSKKDDGTCDYAPLITLNGAKEVTINLGGVYTEQGATAMSKEGVYADVFIDNSKVNTNESGVYEVIYTATFNDDVATAIRTVNVTVSQSLFVDSWTCSSDCGATVFPVNGTRAVVAGTNSDSFIINGFFTLLGGTVTVNFSGMDIIVPEQIISVTGGNITVSGTGTLAGDGDSFTIDYNYDNTIPFVGGSGSCTAVYTR